MAVISLTITDSQEQIVSGIPRYISLSANIPSTIFYTLDGSDPTTMSDIYLEPIITESSSQLLTLKAFATNGIDSSPIIVEVYYSDNSNQKKPHALVTNQQSVSGDYPFGNNSASQSANYGSSAGITLSSPGNTDNPNGYDGFGNETSFTDHPFTKENYDIKYTDKYRSENGVGTLPGEVMIEILKPPPQATEMYSDTFDPKAMVIYQDFEDQTLDDNPSINRMYFRLDNSDHDDDGNKLFSTAYDGGTNLTATFIRSHYNPRKNTITYYYRDSRTNKWIISTQKYQQLGSWSNSLAGIVLSKQPGSRYVFEWNYPIRRTLF